MNTFKFESEKKEKVDFIVGAIAALVATIAVVAGLSFKGFSEENIWDAIKDLAQLLGVIGTVLISSRYMRNKMEGGQQYLAAGENALKQLQRQYENILQGPKFNRDNYDESSGHGKKYLFLQSKKGKEKYAFMTLDDMREGMVDVRVSKGTLKVLDINKDLNAVQREVFDQLQDLIQSKYSAFAKIEEDSREKLAEHGIAFLVDFEEEKMGAKKFSRAVYECGSKALEIIRSQVRLEMVIC